MPSPKIIIIGAGLGGLALANGLKRSGFDVTVFERDESPQSRAQGYRISIRRIGLAALKELLPENQLASLEAAKVADIGDGFVYATSMMKTLLKIPLGEDAAVQFLRTELRSVLLDGVKVEWNKRFISFEERADKVVVSFEDGSQVEADLLVGCDGGASKVREYMKSAGAKSLPEITASGVVAFGGQIERTPEWDELLPLNAFGAVRFLGPGGSTLFVCFSERQDRSPTVFWGISELADERERPLDHCQNLLNNKAWHPSLRRLIRETKSSELREPWFLRTTQFPKNAQYPMMSTGRVTLLGDAAHSMPPDRGLGGNNVLEDARLLTSILGAPKPDIDWSNTIAQYETQMFARAKKAVDESNKAAKMHITKGPISILLRNTMLKIVGFLIAMRAKG